MANTTNFGWETPDDTDLVKDGAAAMRTLGNAIDTSFVDLKGGTTGQILSKASNTDLDYTWITNDVGDITSVGVTSPITGGGTSGAVTIAIDDASTTQKGAVQLEDSTSSTSTTKAATPNSVKTAYDLANGAIAKSLVDAKGDLLVGSADNTIARLAVGTNDYVLTADSTATNGVKWAAASAGGTYSAWTPTRTNWTLGNGTETARYTQIGKFVHLEYKVIWGSTSSISGDLKISLPVTAKGTQDAFFGDVSILDSGTAWYLGKVLLDGSTTTMSFVALKADSTYQTYTTVAASAPMSWATNDRLIFSLVYEAA